MGFVWYWRQQFVSPEGIATDGAGNVYVIDNPQSLTKEFKPDGTFVRSFGQDDGPSLGVSQSRHVFLVNQNTRILTEFAPDGSAVRAFDLRNVVDFANGIVVDAGGHIWVVSESNGGSHPAAENLLKLEPDGLLDHVWPIALESFAIAPAGDRLYGAFLGDNHLSAYALPAK